MVLALQGSLLVKAFAPRMLPTAVRGAPSTVNHNIPMNDSVSYRAMSTSRRSLPSMESYLTEPFVRQLTYAKPLVSMLDDTDQQETAEPYLTAQLSHSDGIRGFFATYLTTEPPCAADQQTLPVALQKSLGAVEDASDLVSLACMNVIMPTAMTTMHADADNQEASRLTADRGLRVLQHLATLHPDKVNEQCEAMLEAIKVVGKEETEGDDTEDGGVDPELVAYWQKFYGKWGYETTQLDDIATAIRQV